MQKFVCALFLLACMLSACSSSNPNPTLSYMNSYEGGTLYRTNGSGGSGTFHVLVLNGSWRQMGRQYGQLMKDQMERFYDLAVNQYLLTSRHLPAPLAYDDLKAYGDTLYALNITQGKDLIDGMAETSGMTLEKQKIVSCLMGILFEACSSMDAWGDYTGGGPLVVGRNWDTGTLVFKEYAEFLTVVVFNPNTGENGVADINYAGSFSTQSGMNSKGVFLDLQNGELSESRNNPANLPGPFRLFSFLLSKNDAAGVHQGFTDYNSNMGLIINAATSAEASVYEWATDGMRRRTGSGLIASANHYIDPTWTAPIVPGSAIPAGAAGSWSKERLDNLLARGEQYKGSVNAYRMMDIFDLQLNDGGPSFPDMTMYHLVAVPLTRDLWVKTPGYSGWEYIPLGTLFQ